MDFNLTEALSDITRVINTTNATLSLVNSANVSDGPVTDLYEVYRLNEKNKLLIYRVTAYILAVLIILSNLTVVISSGLILRKGQKPRSTYILLGNVSLADMIVGLSIIYGLNIDYTLNNNPMCVFQTGIIVSPAIASIFSVGLIAVDRYIYILHGLYYQRWFNTTRVRIGILLIWMISLTLGFLPVTGWVNHELILTRCIYVGLFPGSLILLISFLSIIPIIVVAVLYAIILTKALKTVNIINSANKIKEISELSEESVIRMNRRTFNLKTLEHSSTENSNRYKIKRSASFSFEKESKPNLKIKSKSTDDISEIFPFKRNLSPERIRNNSESKAQFESEFSVSTSGTTASIQSVVYDRSSNVQMTQFNKVPKKREKSRKNREPSKWRAIKVVILTTASLILTWMPFFVTVIFYVFCEEKLTNPKCIRLRALLGGPLAILAFVNSILNPIIYAWWHKGFKKSAKSYYKQYLHKYICRVVR